MVSISGLNLGRSQRVVTPALRKALEARDGRVCWMPGCDHTHDLDAHHLIHWSNGGTTDLDNLILVCPYHHRLQHEGGWRTTRRRGWILPIDRDGQIVHERPQPRGASG